MNLRQDEYKNILKNGIPTIIQILRYLFNLAISGDFCFVYFQNLIFINFSQNQYTNKRSILTEQLPKPIILPFDRLSENSENTYTPRYLIIFN